MAAFRSFCPHLGVYPPLASETEAWDAGTPVRAQGPAAIVWTNKVPRDPQLPSHYIRYKGPGHCPSG